jgi:hypothetical protein
MKTSCGKNEATEEAYCKMLHQHIEQLSTDDLKENAFEHLYEEHRYGSVEEIYNMLKSTSIPQEDKKLLQKHYGLPQSGMKRICISSDSSGRRHWKQSAEHIYEIPKKFALNLVTAENYVELLKPYYIATNNKEYTHSAKQVQRRSIQIEELNND